MTVLASVVFLLTEFKVPTEDAVALTVSYLIVLLLVTTPGGFLILFKNKNIL